MTVLIEQELPEAYIERDVTGSPRQMGFKTYKDYYHSGFLFEKDLDDRYFKEQEKASDNPGGSHAIWLDHNGRDFCDRSCLCAYVSLSKKPNKPKASGQFLTRYTVSRQRPSH